MSAGVAGRYATALFELARDEGQLDGVAGELAGLHALLEENKALDAALQSPVIALDEKRRVVARLVQQAGFSGIVGNFLGVVARNNRLAVLRDIMQAFMVLMARARGEVQAEVISASALSEQQGEALVGALKAALGQEVTIRNSVDPALLGGVIVRVGSRLIDNSLRTKLDNLHAALERASEKR